ncbi:O-antigen ligase family protein [Candidatus Peregrinibacteria bacterium]|nr:O-antigen ligase family protein [Candidatus Peregrinibacteria bacterium]
MIAEPNKITQQFLPKVIYWILGGLIASTAAILFMTQPEQVALLILFGSIFFLTVKNTRLGLHIALLLPLFGELVRLPITSSTTVLVSDAIIPVIIAAWIFKNLTSAQTKSIFNDQSKNISLALIIFVVVAGLSLLQSLTFLSFSETLGGSLYLVRYLQYALLYFITLQSIETEEQKKAVITTMTISAIGLAIAGFIQLVVYPDLADLEQFGYDPHINRLVSVWLDPNFVGGFLSFIVSILLGIGLHTHKNKSKVGIFTIIAILSAAIFLTYSRSAYLAFAAGVFIISLLKSRKILLITIALFLVGITVSDRAQERVGELTQSIIALAGDSVDTPDPTAALRLESWRQTWSLIEKRPILGSGYNNLRTVNHQEGFTKEESTHSGSGSDSSLLTIGATTGILGFIPFILIYIFALTSSFQIWRNNKNTPLNRGYALGILGGMFALLVHSIFVNSLLFAPILLFFWIALALLQSPPKEQSTSRK